MCCILSPPKAFCIHFWFSTSKGPLRALNFSDFGPQTGSAFKDARCLRGPLEGNGIHAWSRLALGGPWMGKGKQWRRASEEGTAPVCVAPWSTCPPFTPTSYCQNFQDNPLPDNPQSLSGSAHLMDLIHSSFSS